MTEDMVARDIEDFLRIVTDIILENMEPEEQQYSEDTSEIVKLNRDQIRLLPRDVRLLLTKVKSEEAIQTSAQVTSLLDAYYSRPLWLRKKVRPEYIAQLKMLEVQDADDRLEDPTEEQIAQEQQAMANQNNKPPQETITAKLEDFPPAVLPQVLQKYFGITWSPQPGEMLPSQQPPVNGNGNGQPTPPPTTPHNVREPHVTAPPSLQARDSLQQPTRQ
jgi:hypothetical protein